MARPTDRVSSYVYVQVHVLPLLLKEEVVSKYLSTSQVTKALRSEVASVRAFLNADVRVSITRQNDLQFSS